MPPGVAIGALIGICFGLGWAGAGLQSLPSRWRSLALSIAVVTSVLIGSVIFWRWRSVPRPLDTSAGFNGTIYGWAVALETIAIIAVVLTLPRRGLTRYVVPAIAFIVGLHFFGLAYAVAGAGRVFLWTGAAMCMVAGGAVLALARGMISSTQSMGITCFGCAVILWITAASTLL